jgi:hypothetical protein
MKVNNGISFSSLEQITGSSVPNDGDAIGAKVLFHCRHRQVDTALCLGGRRLYKKNSHS